MSILDRLTEDDIHKVQSAMTDVARLLVNPAYRMLPVAISFSQVDRQSLRDEVHRFRVNLESAIALLETAGCADVDPLDGLERCPKAEAIDFFRARIDACDKEYGNEHSL